MEPLPRATPPSAVTSVLWPIATASFTVVVVPASLEPIVTVLLAPVTVRLSPTIIVSVASDTVFWEPIAVMCCTLVAVFPTPIARLSLLSPPLTPVTVLLIPIIDVRNV